MKLKISEFQEILEKIFHSWINYFLKYFIKYFFSGKLMKYSLKLKGFSEKLKVSPT